MEGQKKKRRIRGMQKRALAVRLCAALALSGAVSEPWRTAAFASPEFAYSAEKWASLRDNVLEYGELADLIHEYNASVINNRIEYDEYRGKSHDDLKNAYQDAAERLYDASDKMMDATDEGQEDYGRTAAQSAITRVQAEQSQDMADSMNEDGRVKKLEYEKQEALLVKEAQTVMISYWQKEKELPGLREALAVAWSQYEAAKTRAASGMLSEAELLAAREKAENAQAAILTNEKERDGLRRELCVMTGWSYDAMPDIREVPIPDPEETDAIDWNQDKERAVEANFTQAANERRFQHTTYGKSQWDVMQKKVESGRQYIESDVEAKYQLLKQAQADYIQALGEYELAAANANAAERRFQLGMISKNQCQEEQKGLAEKQAAKEIAGLSYRQAMENYRWAVNGLAQAEV